MAQYKQISDDVFLGGTPEKENAVQRYLNGMTHIVGRFFRTPGEDRGISIAVSIRGKSILVRRFRRIVAPKIAPTNLSYQRT